MALVTGTYQYPTGISNISKNMRVTGMLLFRSTLLEAMGSGNSPICIVHMAQAVETLIKARIADQDAKEIFEKPKKVYTSLEDFLYNEKSIGYKHLSKKLKSVVGIEISNEHESNLEELGKTRNQIVHLSLNTFQDLHKRALGYANDLLDPLCRMFWNYSVIDFIKNDPWLSEYMYQEFTAYFDGAFLSRKKFDELVPMFDEYPLLRGIITDKSVDWDAYKIEVEQRIDSNVESDDLTDSSEELNEINQQIGLDEEYRSQIENEKQARWESFIATFQSV